MHLAQLDGCAFAFGLKNDFTEDEKYHNHTRLTMYYIRLYLYKNIKVSLRLSQCYFTQCTSYSTKCMSAIIKSIQMGTITVHIVTNTLREVKEP